MTVQFGLNFKIHDLDRICSSADECYIVNESVVLLDVSTHLNFTHPDDALVVQSELHDGGVPSLTNTGEQSRALTF
jgi:hypothetical protein